MQKLKMDFAGYYTTPYNINTRYTRAVVETRDDHTNIDRRDEHRGLTNIRRQMSKHQRQNTGIHMCQQNKRLGSQGSSISNRVLHNHLFTKPPLFIFFNKNKRRSWLYFAMTLRMIRIESLS